MIKKVNSVKKIFFVLMLSSFVLTACSKSENQSSSTASTPEASAPTATTSASESTEVNALPISDTAETSLDWAGEYKGVFPCADCEGIKMELELKADKTYELSEKYLGKGKDNEFKSKGTFSFDAKNPSVITLDQAADHRKFFIGENFAEARDIETGKAIDSKLNYKLSKDIQ